MRGQLARAVRAVVVGGALLALVSSCDESGGAVPPVTTTPEVSAATTSATVPAVPAVPAVTALSPAPTGRYVFPIQSGKVAYGHTHGVYPATDMIAKCGLTVVAPTDATVTEVRRVDSWNPKHDNPALRGGESVTMLGTDGVRYYGSHLQNIRADLAAGMSVQAGEAIAQVGQTGDARLSTCHLHFGISPPCPGTEWKVRRGAIYPWPYLDAWKAGRPLSPAAAVNAYVVAHPKACADAMAEPTAPDAG
jgi:hypothetical protein